MDAFRSQGQAIDAHAQSVAHKRVIIHVDLDAFYCQVEMLRLNLDPTQPMAVQQWQGLIAVNYPARAAGISRHAKVDEAMKTCPGLRLVHVETLDKDGRPNAEGASRHTDKVSLQRYRLASTRIFKLLLRIIGEKRVEKASVDEAYLDVSALVDDLLAHGKVKEAGSGGPSGATGPRLVSTPVGHSSSGASSASGASGPASGAGGTPAAQAGGSWSHLAVQSMLSREDTYILGSNGKEAPSLFRTSAGSHTGEGSASVGTGEGAPSSQGHTGDDPLNSDRISDVRIAAGGVIAAYIRQRMREELGYTASAGVAHNKMLAKLASARNKPSRQTLVTGQCVAGLMARLPLRKIRFLGGKIGAALGTEVLALTMQEGGAGAGVHLAHGQEGEKAGVGERPGEEADGVSLDSDYGSEEDDSADEAEDGALGPGGRHAHAGPGAGASRHAAGAGVSASIRGGDPYATSSGSNSVALVGPGVFQVTINGQVVEKGALDRVTAGSAQRLSLQHLRSVFGEQTAAWLHGLVRGQDDSAVVARVKPKQLMAAKSVNVGACTTYADACRWLRMLCAELVDRLSADEEVWERTAKKLTLYYARQLEAGQTRITYNEGKSKAGNMPGKPRTVDSLHSAACSLLRRVFSEESGGATVHDGTVFPLYRLALSASGFVEFGGTAGIGTFFHARPSSEGAGAGATASSDSREAASASTSASAGSNAGAGAGRKPEKRTGIAAFLQAPDAKRPRVEAPTQPSDGSIGPGKAAAAATAAAIATAASRAWTGASESAGAGARKEATYRASVQDMEEVEDGDDAEIELLESSQDSVEQVPAAASHGALQPQAASGAVRGRSSGASVHGTGATAGRDSTGSSVGRSDDVRTCPICNKAIPMPASGSTKGPIGPAARMQAVNAHVDACLQTAAQGRGR